MRRWTVRVAALLVMAALVTMWWSDVWPFGPKRVRICRAGGEPIMGAVLILKRPGEPEPDFGAETHDDSGWLKIPRDRIHDGAEMFVMAPACALVRGELPWGFRIDLPDGVPVRLRVDGDFELPRRPSALRVELEPVDEGRHLSYSLGEAVAPPDYWKRDFLDRDKRLAIDPDTRSVAALVPRTGRWIVRWYVDTRTGDMWSGSGPDAGIPVEIREPGATVLLTIDPRELAENWKR